VQEIGSTIKKRHMLSVICGENDSVTRVGRMEDY